MTTYTRKQIEAGEGFMTTGGTCVIQRGDEDVFLTRPQSAGWELKPDGGFTLLAEQTGTENSPGAICE